MSKKIIIGIVIVIIALGLVIGGLILFKHEHDVVIDKAVEPTCEDAGLTKGKHCDDCGEVIVAQKEIPALGHTITVFASIEPTCTTTGKTEGMVCTVCNKVLAEQEVLPVSDHVYDGEYDRFCNVCSFERAIDCRHDIPEKIIEYPAVEPTCEKTGLTEGKRCLECDKMIVPQSVVPKLDCIEGYWVLDYLPTIDTDGKKHTECVSCGKVIKEEAITSYELLSDVKISAIELIRFCLESVEGENGSAILSEDKMNAIKFISAINTIGRSYYTADEFEEALSIDVMENFGIASYQIKQMYGLYLWDEFTNDSVEFETMLDYLTEISEYPEVKQFMSEETATQLKDLSAGLDEFKEKMNTQLDKKGFVEFCKNEFGNHAWVAPACEFIFAMAGGGADTITTIELLSFVDKIPSLMGVPESYKEMIRNYLYVYDAIAEPCAYTDFIPVLRKVILALTNEEYEIEATAETIQQVYIMYYRERIQSIPNKKIQGIEFIEFIKEMIATNIAVASQISEEDRLMLMDLVIIYDFISDFNTYNYEEMIERTHSLSDSVSSMSGLMIFTDEDVLSMYIHYAINN